MIENVRHELQQLVLEVIGPNGLYDEGLVREMAALIENLAAAVADGRLSLSNAREILLSKLLPLPADEYHTALDGGGGHGSEPADEDTSGGFEPGAEAAPEPRAQRERRTKQGGTRRRGPILRRSAMASPAAPVPPPPTAYEDRTVFPELSAPGVVVAKQEFELRVGFSPTPKPDVISEGFKLPPNLPREFPLAVQVVATGFTTRADEALRHVLMVRRDDPYPTVTIHLKAAPQQQRVIARSIQALYSVAAQTIGMAVRSVSVVKSAALLEETGPPPQAENRDFAVPVGATAAPDVTVRLVRDRARPGEFSWAIETRFEDVKIPKKAPKSEIGTAPDKFARLVMNGINARHGKPDRLASYLNGVAKKIGTQHVPADFWRIFHEVAARVGGPPTILFLSEEPYVPWELAQVKEPLPDPNAAPFLAAQAVIGRWPLGTAILPPPEEVNVQAVAVVSGVYAKPGWQRLQAAEEEAATLVAKRFGKTVAYSIDATPECIIDCLKGKPPADLLHFAVHGSYDPNGHADGIVLVDGSYLDPLEVSGSTLERRPFVFLNACQVGQGNVMLGDYAGMAEAFLSAGASAVIAPLWSIKDTLARDAAFDFYQPEATQPAHSMRKARAASGAALTPQLTLRLAYQFFGHPGLKLRLPAQPAEGSS
jgi:hypothetical protein